MRSIALCQLDILREVLAKKLIEREITQSEFVQICMINKIKIFDPLLIWQR